YVVTEHSTRLSLDPADHKHPSPVGLDLARAAYAEASAVLPVSRYLRDSLDARGLPGRKVVVPNPLDTSVFYASPHRADDGTVRVVSVGRLAREKQPALLLDAFAAARSRDARYRLEFIGDGPLKDELIGDVKRRGLHDAVSFAGHVRREDVAARLRASDVFA